MRLVSPISVALGQALFLSFYVSESSTRPDQVAQIPINQRRNVSLKPKRTYRTPITL